MLFSVVLLICVCLFLNTFVRSRIIADNAIKSYCDEHNYPLPDIKDTQVYETNGLNVVYRYVIISDSSYHVVRLTVDPLGNLEQKLFFKF